jgi:DNA-3-methyladenine glycosylase
MLNVVAGAEGSGAAVLVRSAGGVQGPGRLGTALELSMELNGKAGGRASGLWFEDQRHVPERIIATPRIGVAHAGLRWSARKLRFVIR